MVILKYETDLLVAKRGEASFIQQKRIGPAQDHRAASGGFQRADNMKQRTFSAA